MRPKERRETGQRDLFRARLDQIVDPQHPLVRLARAIDWHFLETRLGSVYEDGPGRPPLATRMMAGLAILKPMHDLSDEVLCERWIENPYFQLYRPRFVRHRIGSYAASAAGESWFCRTAAGVWNPCRSMSQVVL